MKLYTEHIRKTYKGRPVVNGVSVEVKQGEIVGLLGPNGAGKTTSFYMMVGLVRPDEGSVFLDDVEITKLPMYKRAQMGLGYLPQEFGVYPKISAYRLLDHLAILKGIVNKKTIQGVPPGIRCALLSKIGLSKGQYQTRQQEQARR